MSAAAPPLRVALDVSALRLGDGGVQRVIRGLAGALAERADVELIRLGDGPRPAGAASRRAIALRADLHWHVRGARAAAVAAGAAVLHTPYARGPLAPGRPPSVITVHDLAVIRHPATLSGWNRRYSRRTLRRVLAAADAIVAVSADTADDLAAFAPDAADRVRVIPNGVDAFWSEPDERPSGSDGPYVLAVATPEPRKNLGRLADAMRLRRERGAPERLVLVGGGGWGDAGIPDAPWIEPMGRVDDRRLRALYRGASAVAIPSLHEGSGLPALEAFAAGAPVVAARAGALPETCGDAAVLVDPFSPRAIADGIDRAIAERDALVACGRERASGRTWAAAAAAHAALYREVAGG
jgi:glycosyltransferase involved in cell wall biosynthesis